MSLDLDLVSAQNERLHEVLRARGVNLLVLGLDDPIVEQQGLTAMVEDVLDDRPELAALLVDENGEQIDLAQLHRPKPPKKWSDVDIIAEMNMLGWAFNARDRAWVENAEHVFSRAFPRHRSQIRRVADFALRRGADDERTSMPRTRSREHRAPRRRAGSSPRRARAPARSDDDPSPSRVAAVAGRSSR